MRVLLIDNYDSYTYNLAQLMARVYGRLPTVVRNDSAELRAVDPADYDAIVVSPGPGRPQAPQDLGLTVDLLRTTTLPVLGVCLGHQAIGWLSGAWVGPAPQPRHGYVDRIRHDGTDLFAGLPQDFAAVRYHSLCVKPEGVPDLATTAWTEDGVVMALRHRTRPWWGVQFHPESVGTQHGARLVENFAGLARRSRAVLAAPPQEAAATPSPDSRQRDGGWRLRVRTVDSEVDPEWLFRRWFSGSPSAFWLDSSRVERGLSRFSFVGDGGGPHGETLRYRVGSRRVHSVRADGTTSQLPGSIYDVLAARLRERALADDAGLPFDLDGGYVGYLGYEMKAESTGAAAHRSALPDAVWISATRFVAVDHLEGRTYVVALAGPDPEDVAVADRWADRVAAGLPGPDTPADATIGPPAASEELLTDVEQWLTRPREDYLADIAECRRLLREGESYEICLTNSVRLPYTGDLFAFYSRQRLLNAAPYAAFLQWDGHRVACSSPERFLRVTRDRVVESKPIKGTAPRHPDPDFDRVIRDDLAKDPKTRAENMMIVDLLRNDLGQVCEVGTVEVPRFMAVESYTTMHQLVSTVRGRLRGDVDALTATRHCFPGGSMTGAPKVRTMEIIDRLEGAARGVYSGTLGYFALSGACDLNIVIRTAVSGDGHLTVGAGGAIVLDSDPVAEYEEMLLKARAPLRPLLAGEPVTLKDPAHQSR
ncbi:aminodeoxychorismate synthase component I [Planotetraspora sp. A-T 1434]|uniref:aminodeoxychorismate synthase component I n=1 Tax=Planotetraspora sp. A-T 1434 TaxID=2979219 RepID=UPI0021BEB552|nr:aminodeoxychorismate synthase component I [Planotetraspora sp. A-T 1434]MCT9935254.1 aminodeoxychorismate synthase component I [Planotetraspora sp. A-T 1434]